MDPFEAATKEEYFSSDDESETQSPTSDVSEPLTMPDPSLTNMSKDNDDEEEEEYENMDVAFQNVSTATSGDTDKLAKKKEITSRLTEDQMERYESFRRSRFRKADMNRLLLEITGAKSISEPMIVVVSATAKLFVGDIVETARTVMSERKDSGQSGLAISEKPIED